MPKNVEKIIKSVFFSLPKGNSQWAKIIRRQRRDEEWAYQETQKALKLVLAQQQKEALPEKPKGRRRKL